MQEKKKRNILFLFICALIRLFYRRPEFVGTERLPDEPCVFVGNHTQMNGPIIGELYFPGRPVIWCAGEMMHWKEVPRYAYADFWSFKPRWCRPFYRLLAFLITPLSVLLFNNARTIPVYHDTRLITTFRRSIEILQQGGSVLIFPEKNERRNNVLYAFQDKFIDLARFYYKKTGRALSFVPVYNAPALHKTVIGEPIAFDPARPIEQERTRLCDALIDAITALAASLPEHTVVPYRNISRRLYPKNKPIEDYRHEDTRR
ncbi:MAG: hypothetical protein IJH48_01730 [Oscillospiraceae bacterium]|nr:hypothetical protein [Oscillospiraceae bacterium]